MGMQNGLNGLEKYCDDWGLVVNIEKKCIVFKKGVSFGKLDKWNLDHQDIIVGRWKAAIVI